MITGRSTTSVRCLGVGHVYFLNPACQFLTATCSTPDALQVHTGRVRCTPDSSAESSKLAGSPDASHRTYPQRPVHTGPMRREGRRTPAHRTLKPASSAYRPVPYPNWARHCLHRTLRRSVRCSRSQRPVSVFSARNTPATTPNFPPAQ